MTIIECPCTSKHPVRIQERINLFDFFGIDNFHAETDVVGNAFHEMKPVDVHLCQGKAYASRRVPANILASEFFQAWVQPVAVVVNLGEVVVADQARALPGGMPGGAGGQLTLLDEQDVFASFFRQMIKQRHTHDAATHNDYSRLIFHSISIHPKSVLIMAILSDAIERKAMQDIKLGIRANLPQFMLLVVVNGFVGAMVGMERTILPAIAEQEFQLAARAAILSFIVVFGISKALTNYLAGRYSDIYGRKAVLVVGWLIATPVPFMLMWAPTWTWILIANGLLGVSQGLTWSTTVIMKIDLAGPEKRGFAMGINEFAGYVAVAGAALAPGYVASIWGLRPEPFYLGVGFVAVGLLLSIFLVRDTRHYVAHEVALQGSTSELTLPGQSEIFLRTSFRDRNLSSISQAGLVNNLNDGMSWGLLPLFFAVAGMSLTQIGWLAALDPAVWGVGQLFTGAWSDRVGRKGLIVAGMWLQALAIGVLATSSGFPGFASGAVLLGAGTAMVYPTLLAAIGDVAHPAWRASAVGVYRLWRDLGYAIGAIIAGIIADVFGLSAALWFVAMLTFGSGVIVMLRMREGGEENGEL